MQKKKEAGDNNHQEGYQSAEEGGEFLGHDSKLDEGCSNLRFYTS